MSTRTLVQVFEEYQRARVRFVQTVADLATRPQHIDALQNAGVMALLRPLLLDNVPSVQQSAALALGRLASYNEELAQAVVDGEILPQLVYSLGEQNRFFKKSAAHVLRSVAKHSPRLAQSVVDSGAVDALVGCLDEFDPGVKEAASWALGYIARHNTDLARAVVDTNDAVRLLVHCVQEPELSLKRVAASCLADIAKHSPELAQAVKDKRALDHLAPLIKTPDTPLKRQVCQTLAQIAKHSVELAEAVVDLQIFPEMFYLLKDPDEPVRRNAAICVREVVRHTPELAHLVNTSGVVGPMIDYTAKATGPACLPGIMVLGFMASFDGDLALAVIAGGQEGTMGGVEPLKDALAREKEDHIRATAAWSLGQIGQHTPQHAKSVTDADVLPLLLRVMQEGDQVTEVRRNTKRALKLIIKKCVQLKPLEALLVENPSHDILRHVCVQLHAVLRQPDAVEAKKSFVAHGGLKRLLDVDHQADAPDKLKEAIRLVTDLFPRNIVEHFSTDGLQRLIEGIS